MCPLPACLSLRYPNAGDANEPSPHARPATVGGRSPRTVRTTASHVLEALDWRSMIYGRRELPRKLWKGSGRVRESTRSLDDVAAGLGLRR